MSAPLEFTLTPVSEIPKRGKKFLYRSAAIAGAVFVNRMGETERLTVEAFLFTFGKSAADAARAGALVTVAEAVAEAAVEEAGLEGIRIWTVAETVFEPVESAASRGLGIYRVGLRVADETVAKVDVRLRRSVAAVFDAVLDAAERAKQRLWRLFG